MLIMGIDPALAALGHAILWVNPEDSSDVELVEFDTLATPPHTDPGERLLMIRRWFESYLPSRQPTVAALERPPFFGKQAYNILNLGMGYGEALCCLTAAGVRRVEYAPQTIKLVAAGKGNANKVEVRAAIKARFGDSLKGRDDAFDAIAVALTHAKRMQEEETCRRMPS